MNERNTLAAGFWTRATAVLTDLLLIAVVVSFVASLASKWGQYIPIEMTVIVCYAVYTTIAIAWKGQTLGGWMCGQVVSRNDGGRLSIMQAACRSILTALFLLLLGLPFLVVAAKPTKRGWQDVLTSSSVHRLPGCKRATAWTTLFWLGLLAWISLDAIAGSRFYLTYRAWNADAVASAESRVAHEHTPIEATSLTGEQKAELAKWLASHAQDPAAYTIDIAARHQITLLGETHGKKQYLTLLNYLIPELYQRAQVRTIALECCRADQNDDLARLMRGETFDQELAKQIGREAVWNSWAWQGYWDVLKTAWQVNQRTTVAKEKLHVVGIAPSVDLPSLALVKYGPCTEKLRLFRLLSRLEAFSHLAFHDAFYASCVERAAFEEGRRTVVWVGAAHVHLPCSNQRNQDGRVVSVSHRMGAMLFGRYPDQVAQIVLHQKFSLGEIADVIEEAAPSQFSTGFAFPIADSPFAHLRDGGSSVYFGRIPNLRFSDLVSSYLFLVPEHELETCDWMEDFVTPHMFGRNKPFYEMLFGQKLQSYHDANQDMSAGLMSM
ncbi:MAG: ChaN family lipoprotein [Planctomycetales bacterium]|nr:ChaN family lipoprotein [Planctomycetales bacterium]